MGALHPTHLIVIAVIALVVFGPQKLPGIARGLAEGMKELKKALRGITESEPVTLAREMGQTVNDFKQSLNPLAPLPAPRGTVTAAAPTATGVLTAAEAKPDAGASSAPLETQPVAGTPPQS
jgi:sec-independent protein translocase protein TatA